MAANTSRWTVIESWTKQLAARQWMVNTIPSHQPLVTSPPSRPVLRANLAEWTPLNNRPHYKSLGSYENRNGGARWRWQGSDMRGVAMQCSVSIRRLALHQATRSFPLPPSLPLSISLKGICADRLLLKKILIIVCESVTYTPYTYPARQYQMPAKRHLLSASA